MTNREENRYNMFNSVKAVLDANTNVTSTIPVFEETIAELRGLIEEVKTTDIEFNNSTTGKASVVHAKEEELMKVFLPVKSALYTYAVVKKDEELKALTEISESKLKRMRDSEQLLKIKSIYEKAVAQTANLQAYGITAETLSTLSDKITALENSAANKSAGHTSRSSLRTKLDDLFESTDDLLKERLDNLVELLREKQSVFYNQYFAARVIYDLGGGNSTPPTNDETPPPQQ
ncbi:MAG: hypothetical protein WCS69_02735 [Ignavibacteriaceae bacterium]|jgi:hypothetical protein